MGVDKIMHTESRDGRVDKGKEKTVRKEKTYSSV